MGSRWLTTGSTVLLLLLPPRQLYLPPPSRLCCHLVLVKFDRSCANGIFCSSPRSISLHQSFHCPAFCDLGFVGFSLLRLDGPSFNPSSQSVLQAFANDLASGRYQCRRYGPPRTFLGKNVQLDETAQAGSTLQFPAEPISQLLAEDSSAGLDDRGGDGGRVARTLAREDRAGDQVVDGGAVGEGAG